MVEMSVAGIAMDASNQSPIVLLRDTKGQRQVPIWLDHSQSHNIMAGIENLRRDHPLTHDLMVDLLEIGNLYLERVIIHSIDEKTFRAVLKIQVSRDEKEENTNKTPSIVEIECRPSDAIALAVRAKCSIWVSEEVVSEASIAVDAEADQEDREEFRQFLDDINPECLIKHFKKRQTGQEEPIDSTDINSD